MGSGANLCSGPVVNILEMSEDDAADAGTDEEDREH